MLNKMPIENQILGDFEVGKTRPTSRARICVSKCWKLKTNSNAHLKMYICFPQVVKHGIFHLKILLWRILYHHLIHFVKLNDLNYQGTENTSNTNISRRLDRQYFVWYLPIRCCFRRHFSNTIKQKIRHFKKWKKLLFIVWKHFYCIIRHFYSLEQTAHISSRPFTYGGHFNEPHLASTG